MRESIDSHPERPKRKRPQSRSPQPVVLAGVGCAVFASVPKRAALWPWVLTQASTLAVALVVFAITRRAGDAIDQAEGAARQRSADEALEFADAVIDTVREPLISLDKDLRVVTVSRSFYDFFKVKPEDTVGQLIYDLGNKQWDIPKLRELLETILPESTSFDNYEVEHEFATIGKRTMLLNARQIQQGKGKERIILLAIEDVTERRRADRNLRESETMLNEMSAIAKIGGWAFDTATMELVWTEEVYRIHEVEPTYKPLLSEAVDFYALWAKPIISQALQRAIESGEPFDLELEVITAKNNSRWVRAVGSAHRENDKTTRVSGTFQDITERKEADAQQVASSAYARSLLEASLDPLVTISAAGKITDVNEASVQATGVAREQLIGGDFSDYFTRPDQAREGYQKAFSEGFVRDYPLAIRHVTGRITDVLYNAAVYRDAEGDVLGVFAAARDITARKEVEAGLEETLKELEAFAYSVSHDLRAPLRGIDGWSLALLEDYRDELGEQGREYIDLVRSETQRMGCLIDDLLTFSRQSRGELKHERLDMTGIAKAIVARLRERMPSLQAEFLIQPGLTALGDAGLIGAALSNLLDNAVKFSNRSSHAIIEFGQLDHEGKKTFFVRDNGVGFDMAYSQKLFGVFQRLHKASEFPGTGIGLASAQRIVNRHGGRIWAEAQVGLGATFYFTLKEAS